MGRCVEDTSLDFSVLFLAGLLSIWVYLEPLGYGLWISGHVYYFWFFIVWRRDGIVVYGETGHMLFFSARFENVCFSYSIYLCWPGVHDEFWELLIWWPFRGSAPHWMRNVCYEGIAILGGRSNVEQAPDLLEWMKIIRRMPEPGCACHSGRIEQSWKCYYLETKPRL